MKVRVRVMVRVRVRVKVKVRVRVKVMVLTLQLGRHWQVQDRAIAAVDKKLSAWGGVRG